MDLERQRKMAPKLADRFATEWAICDEDTITSEPELQPESAWSERQVAVSSTEELRQPIERATMFRKAAGAA
jgi:hypothetical protein